MRRRLSILTWLFVVALTASPAAAAELVAPAEGAVFANPSPVLKWSLGQDEREPSVAVYNDKGEVAYSGKLRDQATRDRVVYLLGPGTYTWAVTVENVFGERVATAPRSFTVDPPRVTTLDVKVRSQSSKRRTNFSVVKTPWTEVWRSIYWRGHRVQRDAYWVNAENSQALDPYEWSCKRPGLHGYIIQLYDAHGDKIERKGTFQVPSCPKQRK